MIGIPALTIRIPHMRTQQDLLVEVKRCSAVAVWLTIGTISEQVPESVGPKDHPTTTVVSVFVVLHRYPKWYFHEN